MSKVKTVVVLLRFRMKEESDWIHTVESGLFGGNAIYPTAHDFIQAVHNMHKKAGSYMEITNVVIG